MNLTAHLGDTRTFAIPLRWGNRPFVPGGEWNLLWTLKSDPSTQTDAQAKIQKRSGSGVTVEENTASVAIIHEDTAGGTFTPVGGSPVTLTALTPGTYYWDIQAQRIASPYNVRTVAEGTF